MRMLFAPFLNCTLECDHSPAEPELKFSVYKTPEALAVVAITTVNNAPIEAIIRVLFFTLCFLIFSNLLVNITLQTKLTV